MLGKFVEDINNSLGRNEVHLLPEVCGHGPQDSSPQLVFFLLRVARAQAPLSHSIENPSTEKTQRKMLKTQANCFKANCSNMIYTILIVSFDPSGDLMKVLFNFVIR